MSLAPEEKTLYSAGGSKAQSEFDSGLQGFSTRAFRGLGVVTTEPFEVSDDQDSVQMLTRSTQVGEFYVMGPPTVKPNGKNEKHFMDILIYDEESDRHVRITWEQALDATCAGELPGGTVMGKKSNGTDNMTLTDWKAAAALWNALNKNGHDSKDLSKTGDKYDDLEPVYIVLARPFIEHLMHSAIVAVAGRDTGATLFGPADMQISANTQVKTIEGHYTGHFKSVVTKPQNVYVMRDVCCGGYVAGGNCSFFAKKKDGTYDLDTAGKAIMNRLSFYDDVAAKYPSMLAFPMAPSQWNSGSMDTVMSVTSRLLPWEVQQHGVSEHNSFPGGQEMFAQYANKLELNQIHYGEDMRANENMEFISQGSTNNALCFLGPHRKYNPFSKSAFELVPGQGHWGPDAIPGDARWRRGEAVSLKSARESMVSLEAAASSMLAFGARS